MKKLGTIGPFLVIGLIMFIISIFSDCGGRSDVSTFIESPDYCEYTIQAGQQNFKPCERVWPIYYPDGFELYAVFDTSAYYSRESWALNYDKDWHDWSKLKGFTGFFSANNRNSVLIAWRPDTLENHFQVCGYTNYPGSDWKTTKAITVKAGQKFRAKVVLSRYEVNYMLQVDTLQAQATHVFQKRLKVAREVGTWMGGANNSEGPHGGPASKEMKLWVDFRRN